MKNIVKILVIIFSFSAYSQNDVSTNNSIKFDTIITHNKVIVCKIKEIGDENVKYSYPNEDVLISINKNRIEKIIFSSGREELFYESMSLKKITGWQDWEKVSTTIIDDEVDGLYKLGDVSSKAKAGTTLSNINKIKNKALRKIKIRAAMIGANIIYLASDHTEGHRSNFLGGSNPAEVILTGIAYTNRLPDVNLFKEIMSTKSEFERIEVVNMPFNKKTPNISKDKKIKKIDLSNYYIDNGLIKIKFKEFECTVIYLDNEKLIIMRQDKRRTYNYVYKT